MSFTGMKIKVNSPEHSKQVQDALFKLGYRWMVGAKYQELGATRICGWPDGYITFANWGDALGPEVGNFKQYYLKGSKLRQYAEALPEPTRPAPPMPKVKPAKIEKNFIPTKADEVLKHDLEYIADFEGVSPEKLLQKFVDSWYKQKAIECMNKAKGIK